MKTPREIVEGWHNGYELTDDSWIEMKATAMIEAVAAIQQEAFESGRVDGINQSAEMCGGDSHIGQGVLSLLPPTSTEK